MSDILDNIPIDYILKLLDHFKYNQSITEDMKCLEIYKDTHCLLLSLDNPGSDIAISFRLSSSISVWTKSTDLLRKTFPRAVQTDIVFKGTGKDYSVWRIPSIKLKGTDASNTVFLHEVYVVVKEMDSAFELLLSHQYFISMVAAINYPEGKLYTKVGNYTGNIKTLTNNGVATLIDCHLDPFYYKRKLEYSGTCFSLERDFVGIESKGLSFSWEPTFWMAVWYGSESDFKFYFPEAYKVSNSFATSLFPGDGEATPKTVMRVPELVIKGETPIVLHDYTVAIVPTVHKNHLVLSADTFLNQFLQFDGNGAVYLTQDDIYCTSGYKEITGDEVKRRIYMTTSYQLQEPEKFAEAHKAFNKFCEDSNMDVQWYWRKLIEVIPVSFYPDYSTTERAMLYWMTLKESGKTTL